MGDARLESQLSRFFHPSYGCDIVKLKPGEYFATTRPCIIQTVLGSCVAACIRDTVRGGAGMNHFMLPDAPRESGAGSWLSSPLRYGAFAMESLINEFIKRGSQRADLEAKVFGGATLLGLDQSDVGNKNAHFVIDYLATEEIRIAGVDLRGSQPRKIMLFVETGEVRAKLLPLDSAETGEVAAAERVRPERTPERAPRVDVELF
jgi:chemotaxis protein CheD